MRVSEDRYAFQTDRPVTAVSRARSDAPERATALAPLETLRIVMNLIRSSKGGDRTDLVAVHRVLFGAEGAQIRDLATDYFAGRVLAAAERGQLLIVPGWPWSPTYAGSQYPRGNATRNLAEPTATAEGPATSAQKQPPPPAPAHRPGHLKLTSRARAKAPPDRRRTSIGVGEVVRLTASGATGALQWTKTGSTTLNATSGAKIRAVAHDRAESTTIRVKDGACGCVAALTFRVVEPSAVHLARSPGSGVWHKHGIASIGIEADAFIAPDNVSFTNIEVAEADAVGVVSGYFEGTPLDGVHHSGHGAGNWVRVGSAVAGRGSRLDGQDTAQSGRCSFKAPFTAGTFDWAIPWLFRVGGGAGKAFATVHERFTVDVTGRMTVTKADANGAAELNDPSSDY
jgi:hypothetical protein